MSALTDSQRRDLMTLAERLTTLDRAKLIAIAADMVLKYGGKAPEEGAGE